MSLTKETYETKSSITKIVTDEGVVDAVIVGVTEDEDSKDKEEKKE